jgi:hypothetical protein
MNTRNSEQRLQDALNALPREVLPQRDLWPGIAHALLTPERAPTPPWYHQAALAASIVLVMALSLYFVPQQTAQQMPNSELEQILSAVRDEHALNKQMLLVRYEDREPYYAGWQEQLQQLEGAEARLYEAIRQDPENLQWLEALRRNQRQQLNLIEKVFDPSAGTI